MNPNQNILSEMDASMRETIMKAAETISSQTFAPPTRSIFVPENISGEIKLIVPTATPIRNRLPRVEGYGQAAVFRRLTSKLQSNTGSAGVGTNTSVVFADAGSPNQSTQTYDTVAYPYKLLGRKIEVGGLAIAASRGGTTGNGPVQGENMLDARQKVKAIEVMIGEEELIISGDVNNDPLQFDGLGKQIVTNSGNSAYISASGIGAFCNQMYNAGGDPSVFLHNPRQGQAIADNLQASGSILRAMISTQDGVTAGYKVKNIINHVTGNLIDSEVSRYVGGTSFLLTEKDVSGENWIQLDELIPMSVVDIPSSNLSSIRFVIEALVLEVIAEPLQLSIGGQSLT